MNTELSDTSSGAATVSSERNNVPPTRCEGSGGKSRQDTAAPERAKAKGQTATRQRFHFQQLETPSSEPSSTAVCKQESPEQDQAPVPDRVELIASLFSSPARNHRLSASSCSDTTSPTQRGVDLSAVAGASILTADWQSPLFRQPTPFSGMTARHSTTSVMKDEHPYSLGQAAAPGSDASYKAITSTPSLGATKSRARASSSDSAGSSKSSSSNRTRRICARCNAVFGKTSSLTRHIKSRHLALGELPKPFRCRDPECNYSSHQRTNVLRHETTVHRMDHNDPNLKELVASDLPDDLQKEFQDILKQSMVLSVQESAPSPPSRRVSGSASMNMSAASLGVPQTFEPDLSAASAGRTPMLPNFLSLPSAQHDMWHQHQHQHQHQPYHHEGLNLNTFQAYQQQQQLAYSSHSQAPTAYGSSGMTTAPMLQIALLHRLLREVQQLRPSPIAPPTAPSQHHLHPPPQQRQNEILAQVGRLLEPLSQQLSNQATPLQQQQQQQLLPPQANTQELSQALLQHALGPLAASGPAPASMPPSSWKSLSVDQQQQQLPQTYTNPPGNAGVPGHNHLSFSGADFASLHTSAAKLQQQEPEQQQHYQHSFGAAAQNPLTQQAAFSSPLDAMSPAGRSHMPDFNLIDPAFLQQAGMPAWPSSPGMLVSPKASPSRRR